MNKFIRWPVWIILAALFVAALVPAVALTHGGRGSSVHAANSPTLSAPAIVHPFDTITITGQGFVPGDAVSIFLGKNGAIYGGILGTLTCDSSGNCSGQAVMSATGFAQGTYQLIGQDNNGVSAQVDVQLFPGIKMYTASFGGGVPLTSGGPGTAIQLEGGAFNPSESIN
ncbi:MAG TPA: hypothetical protein VIZ18_19585, partial [Ktedonobacteraceae bacterium]